MAYRRGALIRVVGFDERFPRAYREDADLALRMQEAGYRLLRGSRTVLHPVGPAGFWVSVRLQSGNADDSMMAALHGRDWHQRAGAPAGRQPFHALTVFAAMLAVIGFLARRRILAVGAGLCWLGATAEFARARIAPGPKTPSEIARMSATSLVIPFAACFHRLRGWIRWRNAGRRPRAVVFDRDGTLVVDVPYNGDPERVALMPAARRALERLRAAGIPTAVISNQSGVARGRLTMEQVAAVNQRIELLLGPLGPWFVCPHSPEEGCNCRKPAPGLLLQAARSLGVEPRDCVVVGDIGADIEAARAAGARAILVPTPHTRADEVLRAPEVAPDLEAAVERLLAS
jgi:histidinol-phosphate phosphatase family protein